MTYRAEDLAVVVSTGDRPEPARRCLAALADQSVEGFSTTQVGAGGRERNSRIGESGRPLTLLVGDDIVAEPTLVAGHLDGHNRRPATEDAVAGPVRWHPEVAGGRIQRWVDWSGTRPDLGAGLPGPAGWARFSSSNVSFKTDLFARSGGFDEGIAPPYADLDLGWRMEQEGMRLWYEPGAVGLELNRYGWDSLRRRFELLGRSEHGMAARHAWFDPVLRRRCLEALRATRGPGPLWPLLADRLPAGPWLTRARHRADRWYHRRLAPYFLNGWASERDMAELRAYLGDRFDEERLWHHSHDVEAEEEAAPDETTFYRTSEAYLYDLTAFASWDTKIPYRAEVRRFAPPGSRLLDYGCGIGADGLRLTDEGYRVDFADFANPSTRYLRWRLDQRGVDASVFDVDGSVPGGYDLVYSFDVIEHVEDPFAFLAELEARGRMVAVNFLEPAPDDTHLHRPLPVPRLLQHAERRGLLRYRVYHHRSHFVVYRSGPPAPRPRPRSRIERVGGAVLSRRDPGRAVYFPGGARRGPG